jgi:hypothetical protein
VHDSTGALFFAGYYMKAKDWSIATMDTYLLKQISLPACTTCKAWDRVIEDYAAKGAYARGGRLTVGEVSLVTATKTDVRSDYIVDVKFTQAPDVIIAPHSAPSTENTKPIDDGSYVFVSWVNGRWKVVEEESDS